MRPVEAPTRVLIVPLGTVGRELMLEVAAAVRTVFGAKVLLAAAQHQPAYAFNKDRRQHHSTAILRRLALGRTDPELAVLGLTDADLFVPDMPFVFGEADRAAQAAVVSLARLASGPDGRPVPVERATRRVAVEAVHHLGLLLGLSQCEDVHCAMVVSHKPTDADRKGPGLCGACRSALGLATRQEVEPLCQRGRASCGACCGLYNRRDLARPSIHAALRRRTTLLRDVPRTPEAFRDAAARLREDEEAPIFPSVRVCPLLGFLDGAETRVGCLAHPCVTGGVDLRDCGAYDARTCDTFFCPSHSWLSEEEAALAADVCGDDPYLYGLVVTDVPFLRSALAGVAALTGRTVERRHLSDERFRRALGQVLALKEELAPGSDGLFGAFRPGADGEPQPRSIDYAALGRAAPSPYDELLTCVGADPRSGNDLEALEAEVLRRLEACARALP